MAEVEADANGASGAELEMVEAASSASVAVEDRPVDERLLFCAEVLIGYKVEVQLVDGTVHEGIFHTMKVDGNDTHVVLKYAKVTKDPSVTAEDLQGLAKKPEQVKIFHSDDVAGIVAKDVRMSPEDLGAEQYDYGFETDAAISRGRGGLINRELVAWMPDPDDSADASMFGLEEHEAGWDQFAVNENKFGYTSGWSEDYYTTRLDKSKCGIDEETAARLAREIERGDTSNPHLAEERGQIVDDSGLDEEDKYSGVIRPEDLARLRQTAHHHIHPAQQQNGTGAAAAAAQPRPAAWSRAGSGLSALTGAVQQHQQQQRPQTAPQQPPGLGTSVAASAAAAVAAAAAASAQPLGISPGLPAPSTASAPVCIPARPSASSSSGNALSGSAPGYGGSPNMAGSAPSGDIDPRKEVNKMRLSLTGGSLTKNSPYGTPKGLKSPLLSPLISDPQKLAALNLEPGVTKVDEDTRQEFMRYKAQLQAQRDKAAAQSALSSALQAGKADAQAAPAAPPGIDVAPAAAAAAEGEGKGADLAAAARGEAKPPAPKLKLSKLNPNAKPFTLNINAKPFVPGGTSSTTSSTAAAGPGSTGASGSITAATAGSSVGDAGSSSSSFGHSSSHAQQQQQHVLHSAPPGVGMPPGLGQVQAAGPQGNSGAVALGVPAAAAAAAAGGPPPGLAPVPGRLQQPPPPLGPSVAGVSSGGVQGQVVQGQLVPPPPGAQQQYVGPVPAGAMLPPGTVPGGIMPAAAGMMPGVVPGAVQVMGAPHQPGHLQAMTAAPAAAMGVSPSGMVLTAQGMAPSAVPAAAMAVGINPQTAGMMVAPPGMMPVPRPPMAVAGPAAAAAAAAMAKSAGPGDRHGDQRGAGGPHPPPRGHKGQSADRDPGQMTMQQQLQGPPPPHHPPSMRGVASVVMTPGGHALGMVPPPAPGVLPVAVPGQPADGVPGQPGIPHMAGPMGVPAAMAAAAAVPPPMPHRGDGVAPPPQMMAAGPGMSAMPMQQPLPPLLQHRGGPGGPEVALRGGGPAAAEGYGRGEHAGQDGHRGHREPRSRSGHNHDRDGDHTPTPPGSSGSTPNHAVYARQQQQQQQQPMPIHGLGIPHYPPGAPDMPYAGMTTGPGPMHAGHHGPPHMPYGGSPAVGISQQQHSRGGSNGHDNGHMSRIVNSSGGGPPPGMSAMGGAGLVPPHTPHTPHLMDGPGSGPNSGSTGGLAAAYSPHPPPGSALHGPPHAMQPAPPMSRAGDSNSFSSQGPPSGSHAALGPHGSNGGGSNNSNQGMPGGGGGPHPPPYGPPHGPAGLPHPSMAMSSGGMHPAGMQAAMMPMPMMPPGMMAQLQGQPMMMPYPGGPQAPGGMMMVNPATGGAFMVPAGMQPPYMAYMTGPPAGSPQARPGFYPPGAYPMPMSPGGTVMRPPGAAPPPQQQQHADGPVGHSGGGGPGTPTAPSSHGGVGRTPGSGNRDRPRGPRGMGQHEKRGSGGDGGHGLKSAGGSGVMHPGAGSAPATPPGIGGVDGDAAVNADGRKDDQ